VVDDGLIDYGGIVVARTFADLPAAIQEEARKQGSDGSDVNGLIHNGKIYLIRSRMTSEAVVEATLFHEATHRGLPASVFKMYRDRSVLRAANRLYRAMGGRNGFEKTLRQLGLEEKLRPYLEGVNARDAQGRPVFTREQRVQILVEEMLAFTGEVKSRKIKDRLRELIGAVRAWLREHGWVSLAAINAADIAYLAKRAREQGLRARGRQRRGMRLIGGARLARMGRVPNREQVKVPQRTIRWMGFTSARFEADYGALQRRHPEHYRTADQVRQDVEFVLKRPDDWYPHADGRITVFRQGERGVPSLRIDFRREIDGAYRIVSVYPVLKRSVREKMKAKKKALGQVGRIPERIVGSKTPEQLSIAEYLAAQGSGSSLPTSPSGDVPKASPESVDQSGGEGKAALKLSEDDPVHGVPRDASTFAEAREAARAFQGKVLRNAASGLEATVSRNALDKMLSRKAVEKSETPAGHALAVANLDVLFERAILGWSKPDREGSGRLVAIHRLFTPLVHGARAAIVKMTVKETRSEKQLNPLYTVESVELNEKTPAAWWVEAAATSDGVALGSIRSAGAVMNIAEAVEEFNLQRKATDETPVDTRFRLGDIEREAGALRESVFDKLKQAVKDGWQAAYGQLLGALTLRQLAEVAGRDLPGIRGMVDGMQRMQIERNKMADEASALTERWRKLPKDQADALADMMHEATKAGVDPAEPYAPVLDIKDAKARIRQINRLIKSNPGEQGRMLQQWQAELRELKGKIKQERARAKAYPELLRQWQALPTEAQAIYREARDAYQRMSERMEQALVDRIEAAELADKAKQAAILRVRREFEQARAQGPYFPLQRFGRYYVVATRGEGEDKEHAFYLFDTPGARRRALRDIRAEGWVIGAQGKTSEMGRQLQEVSDSFVAEVVEQLKDKMGEHAGGAAADVVYQTFLQAMPYLSNRIHFIHRKKTPGYSRDALRAFAFNMAHQANQVARMEAMPTMTEALDAMEERVKMAKRRGEDATRLDDILEEARRRFEWLMNPQGSPWTAWATSLGFVWYLGASPAAALVNLSQTAVVALPELGARYGAGKAAAALARAGREVLAARMKWRERGDYSRWASLSDEERAAFRYWHDTGAIDTTQAQMLMGMAETDSAHYSPAAEKAMHLVGGLFHEAEVINREATLLAAYRLARANGNSAEAAMQEAAEATWNSHFDYSNANRARWMQSNWAKVLLLFRSYSQHMTYYLARNFWQSLKGESPEVRAEARKKFIGVLGMTGVFAGVLGLPMMWLVFGLANALHDLFGDEDEPWDAETEFRNALADLGLFGRVVDRGVVNLITGQDWASRTSLGELWFRSPDRDLEGKALYAYWLEQFAGPVLGLTGRAFRAADLWADDHYERAVETVVPKAVKDLLRATRYGVEGVTTLKGDPLLDEEQMNAWLVLNQGIGFTPDRVAAQWDANNQAKTYERRILERRTRLMSSYVLARMAGDEAGAREARRKIRAFNQVHQEMKISGKSLRQSWRSRRRYRARADHGIHLNRRLGYLREVTRVPM